VRYYPSLVSQTRVFLVEAQDALLSGMKPKMSELAISRLRSWGFEVLLKTSITDVWAGGIRTDDGQTITTNTII